MATGKKSFVFYSDWQAIFTELDDTEAGKLIKHVLSYVNDEMPEDLTGVLKMALIPIKQQLKRDLIKWENVRVKRSEAGKISSEKKKQVSTKSTSVENVEHKSTKSTVNVNDNVNVNVNVNVNDMSMPPLEEFLSFAREVTGNEFEYLKKSVELKYLAWKENGWKTGKEKKIKNWKSTLLNTIQYLEKEKISEKKESKAAQTINNYQKTQQILNERRNSSL